MPASYPLPRAKRYGDQPALEGDPEQIRAQFALYKSTWATPFSGVSDALVFCLCPSQKGTSKPIGWSVEFTVDWNTELLVHAVQHKRYVPKGGRVVLRPGLEQGFDVIGGPHLHTCAHCEHRGHRQNV